jgi:hypothetical protein
MFGRFYPDEEYHATDLSWIYPGDPLFFVFHEATEIIRDMRNAKTLWEKYGIASAGWSA